MSAGGFGLVAGFGLITLSLVCMAWLPGADATPWPLLPLWLSAFAGYALAVRAVARDDAYARGGGSAGAAGRVSFGGVWAGAVAVRLALLPATPSLSEDIYRYMWDGWVAQNGVNPFLFAPEALELATLRTDWWALINHPSVPTIYPPGAQVVFLLLAWAAPAWIVFKLAWIVADLGVGWLVGRLAEGAAPGRVSLVTLLYLWNPLLIAEVAWSGHFEPLGIAVMLGAVLVLGRGDSPLTASPVDASPDRERSRTGAVRGWFGGALLGLGGAIKFAPLAAIPALWRRRGPVPALLAIAVPALLYLPYAGAGRRLFAGLSTYADTWEFNASIYRLLALLPEIGILDLGRAVGGAIVAGVALRAADRRWGPGRTLYWTIGAALLVSPTIHPWYVLWILPFACLYGGTAWILFTATVTLAYWGRDAFLATGVWPEPAWLTALIHVPVLAMLVRERARSGRGSLSAAAD